MTKRVHFLGIGGSGTSAAAAIAQYQGFEVTGCDLHHVNEFTTVFQPYQLLKGHSAAHLGGVIDRHLGNIDILAVTPAIYSLDPGNPELMEARKKNIPVLTWQQFVGQFLTQDKFVIAVCGTHGKSTTTAMIAQMLEDARLDPTVLLGAIVPKWKTNYRIPRQKYHDREYIVIEADEFNDNFLHLKPAICVVTNIEMDHPEYFKDFDAYKKSFKKFFLQTKGTIVANLSDPGVKQTLNVHPKGDHSIIDYSKKPIDFTLQIPGQFNILNASATYQVGLILGIDPQIIRQSLSSYSGIGRRFEFVGSYKGAQIYTDFGHHPTEIKTTMEAARAKFPKEKLWLFFEPHMFSRTKFLFDDFVKVFKQLPVDQIVLLDIYPSREVDTGLVKSWQLAQSVQKSHVRYQNPEELKETLGKEIKKGDVVFFMGAGDIDKLARKLVNH